MQRAYSIMTPAELAAWRRRRRLTVREAGADLGISERTMARFLCGKRSSPLTVARMCWALSCMDLLQAKLAKYEGPPRDLTATERAQIAKAVATAP
jgi:transcriptional regulator with XRE-family HTH domain